MVLNNFQNAKNCYYLQTKQREIDIEDRYRREIEIEARGN